MDVKPILLYSSKQDSAASVSSIEKRVNGSCSDVPRSCPRDLQAMVVFGCIMNEEKEFAVQI